MAEVIVAGAGPVGLWLACELRLAGVSVLVLEKQAERDPRSRAVGMQPRILDTFAMRGVVDRFLAQGVPVPTNHFGGAKTRIDLGVLDTRYPHSLAMPQAKTERLLAEHAIASGAELRTGHTLTALHQDADGVTVRIDAPGGSYSERAAWLVGCDGANSAVRQLSGIGFPGTPNEISGFLADVHLTAPPAGVVASSDDIGTLMMAPIGDGIWRIAGVTVAGMRLGKDDPVDLEQVRAHAIASFGSDYGMHDPLWLSRYGNATRQADRYRLGRVLLAGDSAHMFFPAGGQGVNVGIQDAHNLGWKLAAELGGWATPGLLDSYDEERRPPALAVMHNTRAQLAVFAPEGPEQLALRDVFSEALANPDVNRMWAHRIGGYDLVCASTAEATEHANLGRLVPDIALDCADATSLYPLLHAARFVLLDLSSGGALADASEGRGARLRIVRAAVPDRAEWAGFTAALIRPDGHLAWATTETDPLPLRRRAQEVLHRWCGSK